MSSPSDALTETVSLSEARALIECMAIEQSILLLSPPGVGKSDMVGQAAAAAGLECRSLLGTQIASEEINGIPRIVGDRAVVCPPRMLFPEKPQPFCLLLDDLPACSPDVQKAFYSLLLERRLGEHPLPKGSWVVATGNRTEEHAWVQPLSSSLVNRVIILNIRVDHNEWLRWARQNTVRSEILAFLLFFSEALTRPVPTVPAPFSTPSSWASLSRALDLVESAGVLTEAKRRALAFGRLSAEDAAMFCTAAENQIDLNLGIHALLADPKLLPRNSPTVMWFIIQQVRLLVASNRLPDLSPQQINQFLAAVSHKCRFALLVDLVPHWGTLGGDPKLLESLQEATGV